MQLKDALILIVDDETVLLDIMGEVFEQIAGKVFCVSDGAQALETLAAHRIDLIITDVRMPVMDGVTLLKRIKANGPQSPGVILVSGFTDIQRREAYDLGAEALLEKPLGLNHLINVAERSLLGLNERWQTPLDLSDCHIMRRTFPSLAVALREHQIAFGRGGFCMQAGEFLDEGPVNIELTFRGDEYAFSGQGIVRWLMHQEDQIGIELTYVTESSRARVIDLAKAAVSFIPQTTGRRYQPLAS
jgi:CheY-like chemotaxis protein